MSEADAALKGPPSVTTQLTDAQTLKKNPEPLPAKAGEQRVFPPLLASRFGIAEFKNTRKWVCLPEGTSFERCLEPDYWANIANSLTICDVVEIHTDTRSFYGEVYVRDKGRNWAKVSPIEFKQFDAKLDESPADPAYEVAFKGPVLKWCVIRKDSGDVIRDKIETKDGALGALSQYVRGLGDRK